MGAKIWLMTRGGWRQFDLNPGGSGSGFDGNLSSLTINVDKNWNSKKITNLAAPAANQDAATKKYVDDNVPAAGSTATNNTPGQSSSGGSAATFSRSDHQHDTKNWGVSATDNTPGQTGDPGMATSMSRTDHQHGTPNWGSSATNNTPGQSGSGGSATTMSRSDHQHASAAFASVQNVQSYALDTVYHNTESGRGYMVTVTVILEPGDSVQVWCDQTSSPSTIVAAATVGADAGDAVKIPITFFVPYTFYYEVAVIAGSPTLSKWTEWSLYIS
jgi:hypothetical protein